MTIVFLRNVLIVLLAVIICAATVAASAETGKRGDYPRCQEICLSIHTKRMTEAAEDYKRTGNKLLYQDQVEDARLGYSRCIDNCKELIPVK